MKDPADEITGALYTALSGNVSYNSTTIPVYTRVVEFEDLPAEQYIRIGEVRGMEDGPKDRRAVRGSVSVYIDTFFTGKNEGSKKPMNNISNQVTQLIDQVFDLTSFEQILGRVETLDDYEYELDDQGVVFRKLITYSFITEQL